MKKLMISALEIMMTLSFAAWVVVLAGDVVRLSFI
jgi:hypothetical protein